MAQMRQDLKNCIEETVHLHHQVVSVRKSINTLTRASQVHTAHIDILTSLRADLKNAETLVNKVQKSNAKLSARMCSMNMELRSRDDRSKTLQYQQHGLYSQSLKREPEDDADQRKPRVPTQLRETGSGQRKDRDVDTKVC